MMYADTDFFIALVKDDDWLQGRARALTEEHGEEIYTSRATLLELLLISDRFEFDRMAALTHALEVASIPEDESVLFRAADLMDQEGLTAFDAYHAAYAESDPIISSDQAFDSVAGIERVSVEQED